MFFSHFQNDNIQVYIPHCRDLQLKTPFESLVQFLNPANAFIHRSMLSLLYFPIKPFQNRLILHSISPKNLSIALLGPNETTVYLLKRTTLRAHGYHEPPSMNILGNLPLQKLLIFLRKLFASRPLLPKETHTAITFSSSRSTAPQMNIVHLCSVKIRIVGKLSLFMSIFNVLN